ncbi:MAG: hypothetical protein ACFUZC_02815 [Chthoniobacteraceae bacterium]
MKIVSFIALLLVTQAPSLLWAETYYVDVANGNDAGKGSREQPFKTTSKGIGAAQAGDTVEILKVDFPIHETLVVKNKSGQPGRPIVIDGKGNLFTGSDPLKAEDWTEVKPGVFRNDHLLANLTATTSANSSFILTRYYMLWNGVQNRMGRSSKGYLPPLPPVDRLKAGEWTCVEAENAFYIAIEPGQKLADSHIELPVRLNGVSVIGDCSHWVLRNINTTHVINDGFNIHARTADFVFENIIATECGDDGISAHEESDIIIHGLVSRHNSTGMAHISVMPSPVRSTCDRLVLEDNYAFNLLLENGEHVISNSLVSAKAPKGGKDGIRLMHEFKDTTSRNLTVKFLNCQIPFPEGANPCGAPPFRVDYSVKLEVSPDTHLGGEITNLPPRN